MLSAALIVGGLLPGCAGIKGAHTAEFREESAKRMAQMKAATEFDMAQQQFLAGDLDKARRSIENSISMNDKVARSHVLHGRIMIEQGALESALGALNQAIKIDGDHAEAHYYKGIVFERFNQFDNALEAYDAALSAEPTNGQYILASAEMLIDQDRISEAEERLLSSKKDFAHNAGVRQTLGHIASIRGDHEQAAEYYGEAVLLAPDDASLIEDLARAQFAAGSYSEAEASLRRASRDQSAASRSDLQLLRARCLVELNKPVEAREILLGVVASEDGQQDASAWAELGNVAVVLKDWLRVREAGRRATAIAPESAQGYILTAMWQREQNQLPQAVATLRQAVQRDKLDTNAAKLAALIFQDMGRSQDAAAALALAIDRNPSDTQARALLEGVKREAAMANAPVNE
jgi:tetratricopeptide (TPR) repeat protein